MNIKLNRIVVFVMVCRKNSFKKAGKALMISTPAVSKHIKLLESELGITLIQRSTRKIRLTSEGKRFFEKCDKIFYDLEAATDELQQNMSLPKGMLRICAPQHFSHMFLDDLLVKFSLEYPDIQLDVTYDDDTVDLKDSDFDLAIRISSGEENGLTSKILQKVRLKIYAHETLIEKIGIGEDPSQSETLPAITTNDSQFCKEVALIDKKGDRSALTVKGAFFSNNFQLKKKALKSGIGVCVLPEIFLKEEEGVREIFPDHQIETQRYLCIVHREQGLSMSRISAFVNFIEANIKEIS